MAAHGAVGQNVPVGLINQAATCYLDSLLQALYMTPEFRNAIYSLSEEDLRRHPQSNSLPYQLLRLFLQLQTSETAVETIGITDCLGIKVSQQRDVQEFWHEMFDTLQQQLQKSRQEKLIQTLYMGELEDYVRCQTCWKEVSHPVAFLEVPLTLRPYDHASDSAVIHSLEAFVAPQSVDGEDASFCPNCDRKRPALKGLRFNKLPPVLTLMLMRYQATKGHRPGHKLNDRMAFPHYMELGYLIGQNSDSNTPSGKLHRKEHTYELFAVLLHYGSTTSGDYFAYIKSLVAGRGDAQWYCFDDTQVTPISEETVNNAFGGDTGMDDRRPYYSSSANAYMLMYRRCDSSREDFMKENQFPSHVVAEMKSLHRHGNDLFRSPRKTPERYGSDNPGTTGYGSLGRTTANTSNVPLDKERTPLSKHPQPPITTNEQHLEIIFQGGRQKIHETSASPAQRAKAQSVKDDAIEVRNTNPSRYVQDSRHSDSRTSSETHHKSDKALQLEQDETNRAVEKRNANQDRIKQRQRGMVRECLLSEKEKTEEEDRQLHSIRNDEWKLMKKGVR